MSSGRSRHTAWGVPLAAALVALAAGLSGSPTVAVAVAGTVLLGLSTLLPVTALLALFLLSTLSTRYGIQIAGLTLRGEYVAGVLLALALLRQRSAGPVDARRRAVLLTLLIYLVYATSVTILFAPSPTRSLTVLLWFASDCLILGALLRVPGLTRTLVRQGTVIAAAHAVFGIVAWVTASVGGPVFGVQIDPSYGGLAAYGLSYEANIFAGVTSVWTVVAMSSPREWTLRATRPALLVLAPVVALISHTRTALIALVAGLVVLLVGRTSGQARKKAMSALAGLVLVIPLGLATGLPGTAEIAGKFARTLDPGSPNASLRLETSAVALEDLRFSTSVLGLGTNSYGQRHLRRADDGSLAPGYLGNLPLQILYDTGLVGAGILVSGLFGATRRRAHAARGTAILVTLLVVSLSTSFFWFAATWVFVLIGCDDLILQNSNATSNAPADRLRSGRSTDAQGLRARV